MIPLRDVLAALGLPEGTSSTQALDALRQLRAQAEQGCQLAAELERVAVDADGPPARTVQLREVGFKRARDLDAQRVRSAERDAA